VEKSSRVLHIMAACGVSTPEADDSCVPVVRNVKTVQVLCTKNTYKQYILKVPRHVSEQVPRTVNYTDYETLSKQVPYTVNRSDRRTRMATQKYTVSVPITWFCHEKAAEHNLRQHYRAISATIHYNDNGDKGALGSISLLC